MDSKQSVPIKCFWNIYLLQIRPLMIQSRTTSYKSSPKYWLSYGHMFSFHKLFYIQYDTKSHGAKSIISYIDTQLYHLQWWCWYNLYLYTPYKNFSLASKSFVPFGNESKIGEVHQIWMPICIVTKHKK